ncbi:MAG: hypothetical protein Q9210_006475 [Variospora velana]
MAQKLISALAVAAAILPWTTTADPRVVNVNFVKTQTLQPSLQRRAGTILTPLTNNADLQYLANISIEFNITYADDSEYIGLLAQDTITIGDTTLENAGFALIGETRNTPFAGSGRDGFTDGFTTNGVWGISFDISQSEAIQDGDQPYTGILSLMKSEGFISRMAYSLWLNDPDAAEGSILFGGVDTDKFDPPLIGLPIVPLGRSTRASAMNVEFTSLTLNAGSRTSVVQDNVVRSAILDSGTTATILPNDLATTFLRFFGAIEDPNIPQPLVACDLATSDAELVYQFGGSSGPRISIPVADLIEPHIQGIQFRDGSDACLLGVSGADIDFLLLGGTFLRSAYVVYDLESRQIAMAQARLNVSTSNVQEITGDSIPGVETVVASLPLPEPTSTPSAILGPQSTGEGRPGPGFDGQLTGNPGQASFSPGPQATGSSEPTTPLISRSHISPIMKVLENSMIDLDILPSKGQGDVIGEAQAMANNPNIPPEQREKAKGILANVQGVGTGVVNTAGGAVKGVGDTLGNTVLSLPHPRALLLPLLH